MDTGVYSYWDTQDATAAPIKGIDSMASPNQYEFYNYSPSKGTPNPSELNNQFGSYASPNYPANAYVQDLFNYGGSYNNGINIFNELYALNAGGSSSNYVKQVTAAIQTAFNNYINYLNCIGAITGSTPGNGTGNNTCTGSMYSW